ncbi:hypothetical protein TREES_T100006269 [Tupaia chinensis]|uniref:Uncharacterized protein n=1 Tax=Tupaia chinensis TaxID=246437 RepID=L9L5V7_TUPCH|nr:hypothetical protein TREES_T100006269 [Tupaia chinensis]
MASVTMSSLNEAWIAPVSKRQRPTVNFPNRDCWVFFFVGLYGSNLTKRVHCFFDVISSIAPDSSGGRDAGSGRQGHEVELFPLGEKNRLETYKNFLIAVGKIIHRYRCSCCAVPAFCLHISSSVISHR